MSLLGSQFHHGWARESILGNCNNSLLSIKDIPGCARYFKYNTSNFFNNLTKQVNLHFPEEKMKTLRSVPENTQPGNVKTGPRNQPVSSAARLPESVSSSVKASFFLRLL